MTRLKDIWQSFTEMLRSVEFSPINDILDIVLVAVIIYFGFKFLVDRRAGKLVAGVMLFLALLVLSEVFEMRALNFLLQSVSQAGLIALLIVFQPELRSVLEKVGTGSIKNIKAMFTPADVKSIKSGIKEVCKAAGTLSASKTGALIVFERETKLGEHIKTGTVINADISAMLIANVFFNKSPLHDGALLVRDNRLYAAGCFLPLSQNQGIMKELGTRHRAAIGISEQSDAVVVVVSEETGMISVTLNGKLFRQLTPATLETFLSEQLLTGYEKEAKHQKEDKNGKQKNS